MSKMKSHKGAKKRFKVTGTGKLRRRSKNLNHFLEKKSSRRKRRLRGETEVSDDGDAVADHRPHLRNDRPSAFHLDRLRAAFFETASADAPRVKHMLSS